MTLTELGAMGELVGGLAVVLSLLYVGFEVRRNTKSAHAASVRDMVNTYNDLSYRVATTPEFRSIFMKMSNDETLVSLDAEEAIVAEHMFRMLFNTLNSEYTQHRLGVVDDTTWAQSWDFFRLNLLSYQMTVQWWETSVVPSNSYHPDLRELVTLELAGT